MSARTVGDPAFVSFLVLAAAVWFLIKVRKVPVALAADTFRRLLLSPGIAFEDQDVLKGLFEWPLVGDVADHLVAHVGRRAGATVTMTFDRHAARDVPGMKLLT